MCLKIEYWCNRIFGKKSKVYKSEVMFIYNKKLSVVPITTHIKLKEYPEVLSKIYL